MTDYFIFYKLPQNPHRISSTSQDIQSLVTKSVLGTISDVAVMLNLRYVSEIPPYVDRAYLILQLTNTETTERDLGDLLRALRSDDLSTITWCNSMKTANRLNLLSDFYNNTSNQVIFP